MTTDTKETCKTCAHRAEMRLPGEVVSLDVCRRYPPTAFPTPQGIITIFPPVAPEVRCGEYQAEAWEFTQ